MANFLQERPDKSGDAGQPPSTTALALAPTGARTRQANLHRCPNCGAINRGHASICPECGENLRAKPRKIRCRQCGKSASSVLVICPHCGRELIAAPASWLMWGIPAILVLLFLLLVASRWSAAQPVGWLRSQLDAGTGFIAGLSAELDPNVVIESTPDTVPATPLPGEDGSGVTPESVLVANMTPAEPIVEIAGALPFTDTASSAATSTPATVSETPTPRPTETATSAPTPTAASTNTVASSNTPEPTATSPPTDTPAPTATDTPAPSATATATSAALATTGANSGARSVAVLLPTPTPTGQEVVSAASPTEQPVASRTAAAALLRARNATASPTPTPSPLPTATPEDTATPTTTPTPTATTPPVVTYRVQAGDTLSAIAATTGTTIEALMLANSLSAQDVYALRPGAELIISGGTVAAAAPASAAPTVPPRTYTVQPGDTPIAIANSLGVTVDALMAANNLSSDDARRLRNGQVLIVPGSAQGGPVAAPPAAPVAANPVVQSNAPQAIRLDPPQLRSPENNAQISCNSGSTLAWIPVSFMRESDQYLLHLGFVSSIGADGREVVTWVLEQVQGFNNTLWTMDPGLCGLAPQDFGRKWYWYVEVVEIVSGARVRVSAPSDSWVFSWN